MDEKSLAKIRESLIDHEVSLDKDALWNAINKKERRKIVPMRLLVGIVMLALVGLSSYKLVFASDGPTQKKTVEEVQKKTGYNQYQLATDKTDIVKTEKSKATESTTIVSQQKEGDLTLKKSSTNNSVKKSSIQIKEPQLETTPINSNTLNKAKTTSILKSVKSEFNSPSLILANQSKQDQTSRSIEQLISASSIGRLSPTHIQYTSAQDQILNMQLSELSSNKIECYDYRKKHDPWRIEFYGTLDYIDNNMSSNEDNLSYLETRKSSQTQLEGYRAGIRLKHIFRNGLYFESGLEGGWIRDKMTHSSTDTTTKILANQLLSTHTQGDSTIYIYGDKPVDVITTDSRKIYNTFRSISVPVVVGYEVNFKKLFLGVEAGVIYNFYHDFEGQILDPYSKAPIEGSDMFKDQIALSTTGGVQLGLSLTENIRFFSMLSFKNNLSSVNLNALNPIQQHHNSFGLGLGLEFKL